MTGFEQAVLKTLRAAIDKNARKLKVVAKDGRPEKDDVQAGMTAVITVRFPEPQFEGQTKETLGTPQIRTVVNRVVTDWLKAKFASSKRDDKQQTSLLMEKVVGEMKARVSARIHKEISRKKNALETSSLPASRTSRRPSCSSSRATPPWAPPRRRATPSTRRCSRSEARSSTCRRPRPRTCSPTPSVRTSSR